MMWGIKTPNYTLQHVIWGFLGEQWYGMLMFTFVLNCSDHISLPVLQFQSGVFHSLIFWDVADMQNSTIETLLIHVSFGCSETRT